MIKICCWKHDWVQTLMCIVKKVLWLLVKIHIVMLRWIFLLQEKTCDIKKINVAEKATLYAFWASLLCRRMFIIYVNKNEKLNVKNLHIFIEISIILQKNLVVNLVKFSLTLKNMLIDDKNVKMWTQCSVLE